MALSEDAPLGDVLDIDARTVTDPVVPVCDGVRELAGIVLDKLPLA